MCYNNHHCYHSSDVLYDFLVKTFLSGSALCSSWELLNTGFLQVRENCRKSGSLCDQRKVSENDFGSCQKNFADCVMVKFEFLRCDFCCFISITTTSPLHCI